MCAVHMAATGHLPHSNTNPFPHCQSFSPQVVVGGLVPILVLPPVDRGPATWDPGNVDGDRKCRLVTRLMQQLAEVRARKPWSNVLATRGSTAGDQTADSAW